MGVFRVFPGSNLSNESVVVIKALKCVKIRQRSIENPEFHPCIADIFSGFVTGLNSLNRSKQDNTLTICKKRFLRLQIFSSERYIDTGRLINYLVLERYRSRRISIFLSLEP